MSTPCRRFALATVVALLLPFVAQAAEPEFGAKDPGLLKLKGAIHFLAVDTEAMPAKLETRKAEGFRYADRAEGEPALTADGPSTRLPASWGSRS